MLYFAYGSNLYPPQMHARCPGARAVARAALHDWRLILTTRGTANIVRTEGAVVHGGLWKFHLSHVAIMDRWEGVARGTYRRVWVRVRFADGVIKPAITYVGAHRRPGRARPHYMLNAMLPGATAFDLPQTYVEEMQSWLPQRPVGAYQRHHGRF